jgi:hypothetical protein
MNWSDAINLAGDLMSVTVAVVALVWSYMAFQTQRKADAIPLLNIITTFWADHKQVRLVNCGVGVAIITDVEFRKGDVVSHRNLAEIFQLPFPKDVGWDDWRDFAVGYREYIPPGKAIALVQLTEKNLQLQGCDDKTSASLLDMWHQAAIGIEVIIRYKDIYGNEQPELRMTIEPVSLKARKGDAPIVDWSL